MNVSRVGVGSHLLKMPFSFQDLLQTVFENGKLLKTFSFAEVRSRSQIPAERLEQLKQAEEERVWAIHRRTRCGDAPLLP